MSPQKHAGEWKASKWVVQLRTLFEGCMDLPILTWVKSQIIFHTYDYYIHLLHFTTCRRFKVSKFNWKKLNRGKAIPLNVHPNRLGRDIRQLHCWRNSSSAWWLTEASVYHLQPVLSLLRKGGVSSWVECIDKRTNGRKLSSRYNTYICKWGTNDN